MEKMMDLQMSMKIDGVTGTSGDSEHKGWSEIHSWNWGMTSNRKSQAVNDDFKASLNEISVVKPLGIDSPDIRLLFARGDKIANVEISVTPVRAKRGPIKKLLHMKLESVVIKSIVSGGSMDDDFFKEHITMFFDKVDFEFSKAGARNDKGETEFIDHGFRWDVLENKEWS
jgi:type VI secretion system secreted protein Hcp